MNTPITETEFRRRIKSAPDPVYLFYGDEDYLKHNAVSVAKTAFFPDNAALGFDFVHIDRSAFSPDALAAAVMPPPMLAERKLTVVSLSLSELRAGELSALTDVAKSLAEDDEARHTLIINTPSGGFDAGYPKRPSALLRSLSAFLIPVNFERIPASRLAAWAGRHFDSAGVDSDPAVCAATVDYCGSDMFRLSSEIEKISYYVLASGRKKVTTDDVALVACRTEEYDSFALTNALLARKYGEALAVLAIMKAEKAELTRVMGEIVRVVCDLLTVAVCTKNGMTQSEISEATGIKPYPLAKYLSSLAGTDEATLRRALEACTAADASLKNGDRDFLPIERLICSL